MAAKKINRPIRCIDPVIKYCQGCTWGHITYPEWVETDEDASDCTFETTCILGFDQGRPEDDPTPEEIAEVEEMIREVQGHISIIAADSPDQFMGDI